MKDRVNPSPEEEQAVSERTGELYSRIITLHMILLRYKRCMLVYLATRLARIEDCFWEFSNNLPNEYKSYLRNEEIQYFNQYKDLIFSYQKSFDNDLNLTKDIQPPEDLFVSIRVVKDCGEIVSSDGEVIKINKDTNHFLKRSDIEHLLLQGLVIIN